MMPILDEIGILYLDQRHRRERFAPLSRCSNAQPALPGVVLEWVPVAVKIASSPLTASDLSDGHRAPASLAAGACFTIGLDALQVEQAARSSGQHRPELATPAPVASMTVKRA
jgi:hypothetical protein